MKVHIVVTDGNGAVYQGDAELAIASGKPVADASTQKPPKAPARQTHAAPDLTLPVRAFGQRYARGLSGHRKYALLVARLCDGKVGASVPMKDVERHWNSITEPMGGPYNAAYPTRAKSEGWVDTPQRGSVVLLKDWTKAVASN